MAEFIAQEEMDRDTGYWWSPDERHIALARVDETPVAEVERFEIQATGASIVRQRYPATGAANARVDLFVADWPRTAACSWSSAPIRISIYRAWTGFRIRAGSRCSARAAIRRRSSCCVSTRSRASGRVLLTERSDTWVPLHTSSLSAEGAAIHLGVVARWFPASLSLWQRREADPPAHVGGLHGDRRIAGCARSARSTSASGACISWRTCRRPVERQLYWVSLDTPAAPMRVTRDAGWHSVDDGDGRERVRRHFFQRRSAEERHVAARGWRGACR